MTLLGGWEPFLLAILTTFVALSAAILLTRIYGLRSFAQMSAHDFAATVATGSLIATTAVGAVPLTTGVSALGALYLAQWVFQRVRMRGHAQVVDNTPVLLMIGDRVLHDNVRDAGVTIDDLRGKLREANVLRLEQVQAVVLESTGDVSVLHGEGSLDPTLLRDVSGVPDDTAWPATWRAAPGSPGLLPPDEVDGRDPRPR